jgi:cephalosporin hydroxylase
MNQLQDFENEKDQRIATYTDTSKGNEIAKQFMIESCSNGYTYNFSWMGLPIIQFPQDVLMMQEIIFKVKPDIIIETGVARGGSLVFYASMLELIGEKNGKVLGIDVEIRPHNRYALENHPMSNKIELIEGSSIDISTLAQVSKYLDGSETVMVCLDSKHTHDHVLSELNAYHSFVSPGSYLVVFDTTVEVFNKDVVDELAKSYRFKPWGKGSNPKSAINEFLLEHNDFKIEDAWHKKNMITNCWEGVLKKTK